jgi:DNA-binding beta-propeller fold protein YncE
VGPQNAILLFSPDGENLRDIDALDPTTANLRSAVYPSDVITYFGPPQQFGDEANESFLVAQSPPDGAPRYAVLSIIVEETINGTVYRVDTQKLGVASDPDNGDGFLYEEFKFDAPSDLAYAADGTGYVFVTDTGTDSLYVFNPNGVEGVAPPPGAGSIRPVDVSFGGTGSGPLSFRDPEGVAYFDRVVYVADTGNDRIARFRLNTDFE